MLRKQLEVGSDPAEVRRARDWVRAQLTDSRRPDALEPSADTVVLLVSELVTNAVVHTGRPAVLSLLLPAEAAGPRRPVPGGPPTAPGGQGGRREGGGTGHRALRLEVADGSSLAPLRRAAQRDETSGRGLELVELLADRWGWQREGEGKRIWCELDLPVCEQGHGSRKVPARY